LQVECVAGPNDRYEVLRVGMPPRYMHATCSSCFSHSRDNDEIGNFVITTFAMGHESILGVPVTVIEMISIGVRKFR
jgi:hypothetical protein